MRREGYIASLFVSIGLALVSSIAWALSPIADFIERVAWPEYQPDAHEIVALGFIAPPREIPESWRQFRAFIARALDHADYSAGHFDPGRQPS